MGDQLNIKNRACGCTVTLSNGEAFVFDFRFPSRTYIARFTPKGPVDPVVVPVEPKGRKGIVELMEAYLRDFPSCPGCGCIVDEPGCCDAVCQEAA